MDLDGLASCAELTVEHADAAARSSAAMRALLGRTATIARPGEGAPKVLMALARLAEAAWMDGAPWIEIRGGDDEARLSVFVEHGYGMRERVFPEVIMRVPLDEFERAVRLAPHLIRPLVVTAETDALVLAPVGQGAPTRSSEAIEIDPSSLNEAAPPAARPRRVAPERSGIHTHPTVRRMVQVVPEALRAASDEDERGAPPR